MADKINDGGSAFPLPKELYEHSEISPYGMSLRDWFAGMALPPIMREWCGGLVKEGDSEADFSPEAEGIDATICAEQAYEVADAMLKARGGTSGNY